MLSHPRILIAEDESGIADTLQYVLKTDGFVPVWCATAEEAIAQFAADPPALAILDVGLPAVPPSELALCVAGSARDAARQLAMVIRDFCEKEATRLAA